MYFRVEGLVQGVGFRAFVVRRAAEIGVRGFVRNTRDGAVEGEAQADARNVEQFLLDVRQGPRMAQVNELRVESVAAPGNYSSFDIRW